MERNQDFVLDSSNQCFICLDHFMSKLKREDDESQVVSIQSLCHYLKIDMKMLLLNEKSSANFPDIPRDDDEKTRVDFRLKVWLCADCINLNRKITETYKELEKIELILKYNLNSIHDKLNGSTRPNIKTKHELCTILRDEVIRKCAAKLDNISPRVIVRSNFDDDDIPHTEEEEMIHVKEEFSSDGDDIDDEDPIDDLQMKDELVPPDEDMTNYEIPQGEDTEMKVEDSVAPTTPPAKKTSRSKSATPKKRLNNSYTLDSSTGQYHCNRCPETFRNYPQHFRHWKKVHDNPKFSCNSCDAQFNCRTALRHHQARHTGVKFLCTGTNCGKSFTLKHNLYAHQRVTGCGREAVEGGEQQPPENISERHQCHYCGKEFTRMRYLQRHLNSVHLQIRAHECKLCGKTFQRKYQVGQHVRTVHEKTK